MTCPSELNYAPAGSNLLASLTSELVDSSARRYLRRIRYASRARGGKSLPLQKAEKDSHVCDCLFLAEQERFELSRRYNRPTPLAGAPLHHLSISPKNRPWFVNLPDYYTNFFSLCQVFYGKILIKFEKVWSAWFL